MADLIENAISKAQNKVQGNSVVSGAVDKVAEAQQKIAAAQQKAADIENKANELKDKYENIKDKFPTDKDIDAFKQRARAKAVEKKAEIDRAIEQASDLELDDLKRLLAELQGLIGPIGFKLPVLNPKILQAVAIAKQLKELYKFRQQLSKENLKEGVQVYKDRIKKIIPEKPELPEINFEKPELPEVPELPFKKG